MKQAKFKYALKLLMRFLSSFFFFGLFCTKFYTCNTSQFGLATLLACSGHVRFMANVLNGTLLDCSILSPYSPGRPPEHSCSEQGPQIS